MYNCHKRILSPFTVGVKNKKLGITLEKNIFRKKKDKIQLKQTGDHITIKMNDQKNSQTIKVHFMMVVQVMIVIMMMIIIMKNNEQQQLSECFANNCNNLVSTILVVCKDCSGTLLLAEDVASSQGFGSVWNCTCDKENCLSTSLKARPIPPKLNRYLK